MREPDLSDLHKFGCNVFVKNNSAGKLDVRAKKAKYTTTIPEHNADKIPLTATKPTLPSNMHNTSPKKQSISKIEGVMEREELTDKEADNQKEKNNMRERSTHTAALKPQGFYKLLNNGKLTAKSAHISEESDVPIEHNDYLMAYATGAANCDSPHI
ncbi:hypothetical protein SERLA73DRAFT_69461 [Serpula lacrymans var. lacrymans S7.3]|uniref:Uncharacterized protein n=2 Tax=Serpula lacrymans var. lacrymans TaxID=341189 RepID=F8PKR5_SERL3|nr:uncharacterized protein SERLADRAFT_433461 [Serpula lacrymans var. lacrymans S7.9]EGO03612.1 hypothetical protein SERLA73DRAFT_69461 [Serpula lacrymans var. lacrymans S7.3]EGO29483.1 hypothetical protein SERLADRAFT_433461 [Serpula lacrymans var. lacrymans S7.9]